MIINGENKYTGLYFHIPFCASKCPYCDFYSVRTDENTAEKYKNAVIDEVKTLKRCNNFVKTGRMCFDTVYFGGGTPSVFGGDRIAEILTAVNENYITAPETEITVECNPSSSSFSLFNVLKKAGVNRISLGMQSFNDDERRLLGRTADGETVKNAVIEAKNAGFDNISLDIMLGIEKQTVESLDRTVDFCLSLDVPHISAYMLKIEENTAFARRRDKMILPDDDSVSDMYLHLIKRLENNGIMQYEISNFAKKGFESRHNLKYWNCEEYLGIGAAAHSFIDGNRFYFERSIDAFLNGESAVFESDGGDENEYIMLRLRLSDGLKFKDYYKKYGSCFPSEKIKKAEKFAEYGYVTVDRDGIRLSENGFLLSNRIIAELTD